MSLATVWEETVVGKDGLVGRFVAKSTDARRRRWAGLKAVLRSRQIAERRAAAVDLERVSVPAIEPARGFLTFPPGTFAEVDGVVRETQACLSRIDGTQTGRKEQLLTNLLDTSALSLESPYLRFALRPEVVACASRYLGLIPILGAIDCWYSRSSRVAANSQLFHCDWSDLTQVRVYVHASDVTLEDGPLVVIDAARSAAIRARCHYRYGEALPDTAIAAIVGDSDPHVLAGPAGYISLVDTSRCFHQGSRIRVAGRSRMIAMFQFVTPTAFFLPSRRRGGAPFSRLADVALPRWQRLVLGGE
jgi:hypothetical protein